MATTSTVIGPGPNMLNVNTWASAFQPTFGIVRKPAGVNAAEVDAVLLGPAARGIGAVGHRVQQIALGGSCRPRHSTRPPPSGRPVRRRPPPDRTGTFRRRRCPGQRSRPARSVPRPASRPWHSMATAVFTTSTTWFGPEAACVSGGSQPHKVLLRIHPREVRGHARRARTPGCRWLPGPLSPPGRCPNALFGSASKSASRVTTRLYSLPATARTK